MQSDRLSVILQPAPILQFHPPQTAKLNSTHGLDLFSNGPLQPVREESAAQRLCREHPQQHRQQNQQHNGPHYAALEDSRSGFPVREGPEAQPEEDQAAGCSDGHKVGQEEQRRPASDRTIAAASSPQGQPQADNGQRGDQGGGDCHAWQCSRHLFAA
jgi:hypothetical protein